MGAEPPIADESASILSFAQGGYSTNAASEKTFLKSGHRNNQTYGIPGVCWYILVVELCERLAFYTILGSQAFFLEHIGFSLASAGALNASMWTLSTILSVVASWIADVALGRHGTILASGCIYIAGAGIAAMAAWPQHESPVWYFIGVMLLIPVATAGIKSNISNFGADQYDPNTPGCDKAQERFFSIFYLSINVGAAVSYGFFTTFASNGGVGVPQKFGYFTAYAFMAICMALAVWVYSLGSKEYKVNPVQRKSALSTVFECLRSAAAHGSWKANVVCFGVGLLVLSILFSTLGAFVPGSGSKMTVMAFICACFGTMAIVMPCLNATWVVWGATSEEADTQTFLEMLPTLFTGTLAFGALYNPMQFWYQQQACQMDLRFHGSQLSGSFFNIADCFAIVLVTPLAIDWLNPSLERHGMGLGMRSKFGIGMSIAVFSVLAATRLEQYRRAASVLPEISNCAPPGVAMSNISAWWMMLPYFLMGVAEIYCNPTLIHFAYYQSPKSMRNLAVAASFFIQAVSSALFALLVAWLSSEIPNNLNEGHLEYGYFANMALGVCFYIVFLVIVR